MFLVWVFGDVVGVVEFVGCDEDLVVYDDGYFVVIGVGGYVGGVVVEFEIFDLGL